MAMLCKLLCHWATFTDNFFKSIVIQKLSKYTESRHPNVITSISDFARQVHKAHIATKCLEAEKVTVLPKPPPPPLNFF